MTASARQLDSQRLRAQALRARRVARRAVHRGASALSRATAEPVGSGAAVGAVAPSGPLVRLSHAEAVRENGFTVFRNAFSAAEVAELGARMRAEAGIVEGRKFASEDAPNRYPSTREVLFDNRVLYAVRSVLGESGRFLQVSDLHYRHDATGWHRDSVHRAKDASDAPDWARLGGSDYGVVKAILYLETETAAMGFIPGSHASPMEIDLGAVKRLESQGRYVVVDDDDEPNRQFAEAGSGVPFAWKANAGDLLVFDERLYHCGRRVENGEVISSQDAPKFTVSFVFGADNLHSERLYSYFRYARRDLHYRDFSDDLRARLDDHGLVLGSGLGNYYLRDPDELRKAFLRKPETLEPVIAEFAEAARAALH